MYGIAQELLNSARKTEWTLVQKTVLVVPRQWAAPSAVHRRQRPLRREPAEIARLMSTLVRTYSRALRRLVRIGIV